MSAHDSSRALFELLLVPVSAGAMLAVVVVGRGIWGPSLHLGAAETPALIADFISFAVVGFSLGLLIAWLFGAPPRLRRAVLERHQSPTFVFEIFRNNQVVSALTEGHAFPTMGAIPYVVTVSFSDRGVTFWRGSFTPVAIATVAWSDCSLAAARNLPGGIVLTIASSVGSRAAVTVVGRRPALITFPELTASQRDALVSAAQRFRPAF